MRARSPMAVGVIPATVGMGPGGVSPARWSHRGSASDSVHGACQSGVWTSTTDPGASSVPELMRVVVTALAGSFGLGVGAIVGSAIFNILVIPALSGVANRTIVSKEAQFFVRQLSSGNIVAHGGGR